MDTVTLVVPVNIQGEAGETWIRINADAVKREIPKVVMDLVDDYRSSVATSDETLKEVEKAYDQFLETGDKSFLYKHPAIRVAMELATEVQATGRTSSASPLHIASLIIQLLFFPPSQPDQPFKTNKLVIDNSTKVIFDDALEKQNLSEEVYKTQLDSLLGEMLDALEEFQNEREINESR